MFANVGIADRIVRITFGAALLIWAVLFPQALYSYVGWIGIVFVATGLFGWCGLYKVLGLSTLSKAEK